MAKKRSNPLSGKFHDPPKGGETPDQVDQSTTPAEAPAPADPVPAEAPAPDLDGQDVPPTEPTPAPADPAPTEAPAPEQDGQDTPPTEPTPAPADAAPTGAPAPEQDVQDAPPAEQPHDPSIRFVKIADIKPLTGTYVKETPREDYSELIESIKKNGLEKPVILREGYNGELQLVDGFHRCEALKQAGFSEVKVQVYDMNPFEAGRYRREHRSNPDLPVPGKLILPKPPEEPAVDAAEPDKDGDEFEVPKDFTLPIAKEGQSEMVTTLKVADIYPFEGHPFNVLDNKDMWDLRDSVQRHGVMEPVMVINRPAGGYEMVSGHRRLRACQLAGIQTIPAIVRNLDRDSAIIAMVDANLKREVISPMEKARAYQMKTEAMRRKVGRRSKAETVAGEKPLTADQELAQQVGESVSTVQRYKQLNDLVPEMQEMVDKKQIPLNTGADISRMKPDEQRTLADAIQKEGKVPTGAQVKELKKQSEAGTLTTEAIKQSVAPTKREENPPLKVTLGEEDLRPFFPDKRTTVPDAKRVILEALLLRQKLQEREEKAKAQKDKAKGDKEPPAPGSGPKPDPPKADDKDKKPDPSAPGVKNKGPSAPVRPAPKVPTAPAGGGKPAAPNAGGKGRKPAPSKAKKSNPAR